LKNAIRAFSNLAKLTRRSGLAARKTPAFSRRFGAAFLAATRAPGKSTAC